jgi:GNAT superfamily N-acetyltransferase
MTADVSTAKLTHAERARLDFYRSVIAMTRRTDGLVLVATQDGDTPAAVLCWLPKNVEPGPWTLLSSGFVWALLRYGLTGVLRFVWMHGMVDKLFKNNLSPVEYKSKKDAAYVFILGTDPNHSGKGLSSKLLRWQIERHKAEFPQRPVFIETASDRTARLYERIGFREVGRHTLDIDRSAIPEQNRNDESLQIALIMNPDGK